MEGTAGTAVLGLDDRTTPPGRPYDEARPYLGLVLSGGPASTRVGDGGRMPPRSLSEALLDKAFDFSFSAS